MIIVSQDRMSVCNTFDFMIRPICHGTGVCEIVNKLDGNVYGTYSMSTCREIINDIFDKCARSSVASYRFP